VLQPARQVAVLQPEFAHWYLALSEWQLLLGWP